MERRRYIVAGLALLVLAVVALWNWYEDRFYLSKVPPQISVDEVQAKGTRVGCGAVVFKLSTRSSNDVKARGPAAMGSGWTETPLPPDRSESESIRRGFPPGLECAGPGLVDRVSAATARPGGYVTSLNRHQLFFVLPTEGIAAYVYSQ